MVIYIALNMTSIIDCWVWGRTQSILARHKDKGCRRKGVSSDRIHSEPHLEKILSSFQDLSGQSFPRAASAVSESTLSSSSGYQRLP